MVYLPISLLKPNWLLGREFEMVNVVAKKFGKRGAACIWFGIVFIIIGLSFVIGEQSPTLKVNLQFLTNVLPLDVWGSFWTLGGITFLVAAFWKRLELVAFMLGIAITANWSVGYAIQAAFGESSRGWVSAAIYGFFAVLILLISTWAEPVADVEMGDRENGS